MAVIDVARVYLDEAKVRYIGEPRAELLRGFPWRGAKGLRWVSGDVPDPWSEKKQAVTYVGEQGVAIGAPSTPSSDQTWQIWYQTGWLAFDRIKVRVDAGTLPLEALAWPPIKREKSFLIHSFTGELAMTHDEMVEDESEAFYTRFERAKAAARAHAERLLVALDRSSKE